MTNARLALARLALGPFKVNLARLPSPSQKPGAAGPPAAPSDAIASLAKEWLGKR